MRVWPRSSPWKAATLAWALSATAALGLDPRLAAVDDWLYLLQPDGAAGVPALAAADFDLLVIDYSSDGGAAGEFTAAEVAGLKQGGRVVLAYLSIGEAELVRYYWDPAWIDEGVADPDAPAWLGPSNPDFPDNFKVRYWDPGWRSILFGTAAGPQKSYLDRILDQGFDGIYLDIIDAFYYWGEEVGEVSREAARLHMIVLVEDLAAYARTTRGAGRFLFFPQNGVDVVLDDADLLDAAGADYLATIDGVGVEDVFYDDLLPQIPADVVYRTGILDLYLASGGDSRLVLSVNYVWDHAAPAATANVARFNDYQVLALSRAYVPYAAVRDRDLDEILTVEARGGFLFSQPKTPGEIFADGFESGGLTAWSSAVP